MGHTALCVVVLFLVAYVTFSCLYNFSLLVAYFVLEESEKTEGEMVPPKIFCILIPAHNEELFLGRLLDSLRKMDYSSDNYEVVVVADNCEDRTVDVALGKGVRCLVRNNPDLRGKGHALSWGMEGLDLEKYDAVVVLDADNTVETDFLRHLHRSLAQGQRVVQCYNGVANFEESWFTRILHVACALDSILVHYAKSKLNLSSFLMGNGMCLSTEVLRRFPWKCNSLSEDYEYYANLIANNIFIDYNHHAKVFHQESTSLGQASTQRARWSSGKFDVMKKMGFGVLMDGIRSRNLKKIEATFVLLLPNPSMLINLSFAALILSFFLHQFLVVWCFLLIVLQVVYFGVGLYLTRASVTTVLSLLYAPLFLIWKAAIDFKCIIGLGNKEWIRTHRKK